MCLEASRSGGNALMDVSEAHSKNGEKSRTARCVRVHIPRSFRYWNVH
ncbi:MAG: hypothetical protein ACKESB_03515 [Candidatus Hodgkinia cicadicola]